MLYCNTVFAVNEVNVAVTPATGAIDDGWHDADTTTALVSAEMFSKSLPLMVIT